MHASSPSSDPNSSDSVCTRPDRLTRSEDGVILASTKPKKRAGRTKFKETRHPVYRGVRLRKSNKWVCEVREPNKKTRIWLGTYPTAEMAARAHDVAALALRGNVACLNFADSVSRLPVPATNDAADICRAAKAAAEAFRPNDVAVDDGDDDRCSDETSDGDVAATATTAVAAEAEVEVEMDRYMDEDAVFCMPRLISDMAEGLLISPPRCWSSDDGGSPHIDTCLWNFSI